MRKPPHAMTLGIWLGQSPQCYGLPSLPFFFLPCLPGLFPLFLHTSHFHFFKSFLPVRKSLILFPAPADSGFSGLCPRRPLWSHSDKGPSTGASLGGGGKAVKTHTFNVLCLCNHPDVNIVPLMSTSLFVATDCQNRTYYSQSTYPNLAAWRISTDTAHLCAGQETARDLPSSDAPSHPRGIAIPVFHMMD